MHNVKHIQSSTPVYKLRQAENAVDWTLWLLSICFHDER